MVRVISEKLFSPPRSRHSSGEAVDKELAARAVEALSSLDSKRFELSDYESSSDSHWDSEVDVDGDSQEGFKFGQGECSGGGEDIVKRRRERRRERNKLSAQAYRMRRREQSVKTQKVLSTLEEENSRLKNKVKDLEHEINSIRQSVSGSASTSLQASAHPGPQPSSHPTLVQVPRTQPGSFPPPPSLFSRHVANSNAGPGGLLKVTVDNDLQHPRHQAPVDNFRFSQHPAPAPITMATSFTFPSGATPILSTTNALSSHPATMTTSTPTTLHQQPHALHSPHDANANSTSVNSNGNMGDDGGACQNDNMNNNNNGNLLLVMPFGQGAAMPLPTFAKAS